MTDSNDVTIDTWGRAVSRELAKLTGDWFPQLPRAYEKSVVLGGGLNLFPCHDPEGTAEVLSEYVLEVARRAYQAGRKAGKAEIRKAIFE